MKFLPTALKRYYFCTLTIVIAGLLAGCPKSPILDQKPGATANHAQQYLENARQSDGVKRADWLLLASESLLLQERTDKALAVLNTIIRHELTPTANQHYYLLMAEALTVADRTEQALSKYRQITQPELLKKYQRINFYSRYAELLNRLGRHHESALQRIALSELLSDPLDSEENRELLWQSLMQLNNISVYRNSLNNFLTSGWLELAILAKAHAEQPELLLTRLEQWRAMYAIHPASENMPIDMARAEASRAYRPQHIALLLPETGSLAKSANQIRDGFLSAIYQIPDDIRPDIRFYDSSKSANSLELYQVAVDQGASFVIGPLRRKSVETLASREHFPIPVLAINRLEDDLYLPQNFYQFGLPVEDEARQAATKARDDGLSKAIVLVPNGMVGERTSVAFTEQFERLGGKIQQVISSLQVEL